MYAVMILQSTGIKITPKLKPGPGVLPSRDNVSRGSRVGQAQSLPGDRNRVLMAYGDMAESGKWTDIFIKKIGSEHLLCPHSLIFPRSISDFSFYSTDSYSKIKALLLPTLASNRALKEAGHE